MTETQYGRNKIALEGDSDARKYLIASKIRKMGGTSRLLLLDQSDKNAFTVSVFLAQEF